MPEHREATSYDKVAYPNLSHVEMHPTSLAAVAAVCGHVGAPRERYRVLEIGCGGGANLLSMALAAPESDFIGIDLAPTAIELAETTARAAGITNARFCVANILDPDAPKGPFDYVIAHGVYSWAPEIVRGRMMSLCAETLTPNGMAAFSFNVFPGCRLRHALRDMLLEATRGLDDPEAKLETARAFLERRISAWSDEDVYAAALKREASEMLKRDPRVLYHDELGECFEPQTLSQAVTLARANGLDYLCDARVDGMVEALLPSGENEGISGERWVGFEQQRDFTSLRRFRRAVFARADKIVDRRFEPSRLAGLFADAELSRDPPDPAKPGVVAFRTISDDSFQTSHAGVIDLLDEIAARFPLPIDLGARSGEMSEPLLAALFSGAVNLRTRPLACTKAPGERPLASPLARAQAALGETTLSPIKGGSTALRDPGVRAFLQLLDGTRTLDALSFAMAEKMNAPFVDVRKRAPEVIGNLARLGFMVA